MYRAGLGTRCLSHNHRPQSRSIFAQLLVLFSVCCGVAFAETNDSFLVGLSFENDSLVPSNGDNDYTMGLELNYGGELADEYFLRLLDTPLRAAVKRVFPNHERKTPGLAMGAVAYTPDDIEEEELILDDRPYSSLIYFEHRNVYLHPHKGMALKTGALFGLMGTPVAETVQSELHKLVNSPDPRGWDNEVGRGGSHTVSRSDLLLPLDKNFKMKWDNEGPGDSWDLLQIWSDAGASIGYRTGLSARLNMALGWIRRPYHGHGSGGVGPAQVTPVGGYNVRKGVWEDSGSFWKWTLPDELFLSASGSVGYLLHDSSISGYPWDSKFDHFEDHREPWRDAVSAGLTVRWGGFTGGVRVKSDKNELDFSDDRHEYGLGFIQFQRDL